MADKKLDIQGSVTATAPEVPHLTKTKKQQTGEKLQEFMREETKMVRGIFQCFETPGATVPINVKKYPTPKEMRDRNMDGGVEPFRKTMTDGETYEIPLYVARFLNGIDVTADSLGNKNPNAANVGTCSYPVHGFKWGPNGPAPSASGSYDSFHDVPVPLVGVSKRNKRYGFQSLEFGAAVA